MKTRTQQSGFALAFTLVLMALIVIVVVAYLTSTRIERATATITADRLRAKITAESGLNAAVHLLRDNTRYGNYITAMPAPSPSPAPQYTEIYRPTDPADASHSVKADDYLRQDNAAAEILVSRAITPGSSPLPLVDPRSTPEVIPSPLPANSPFALTSPVPALSSSNSFDFNQITRRGLSSTARLVNPDGQPAFGQWISIRDTNGKLIGRYAFFVEDESMKVNLNAVGNTSPTPRPGDLASGSFPATQVQEIDPAGVLPSAVRAAARSSLVAVGPAGSRFTTSATTALLDTTNWQSNHPSTAHMTTVLSRDDMTTARGWKRLDLNALVAAATTNAAKISASQRIANWIRDAWTGPTPLTSLQPFQMFNDDRLRLQIAANIVDYIGAGAVPTDLGDYPAIGTVPPAADSVGVPIIGIKKIPYLTEVDVIYRATAPNPDVAGQANISMSFRFNFFNMFDADMTLGSSVRTIRIKGVPVINKNNAQIFKHDTDTYEITIGGTGASSVADATVPWGGDNVANGVAGTKTFLTGQVLTESVTYTPAGSIALLESGLLQIDVLDANGNRLDAIRIALRDLPARWDDTSSTALSHDFLETRNSAASITATYKAVVEADGTVNPLSVGDPRYRPDVVTKRCYNLTRTDITRFPTSNDLAEMDARAYSIDWYDYVGDRPLVFQRNASMLSVGELGNVSACEYPWRSLYLQYAGRSHNTNEADIISDVQDRRGSSSAAQTNSTLLPQDFVLIDLFKTSAGDTRDGGLNINTQFHIAATPTPAPTATPTLNQGAMISLFASVPVGGGVPSPVPTAGSTPTTLSVSATTVLATLVAGRRSAVAPLASGGPGTPGGAPPIDNNPRSPYFTIGQSASDISRLINQSENATMTGNGRTRTSVNYSLLRTTPTSSTWNRNYGTDVQVEEAFRKISNSITTRGNVFRILYVGQAIKDFNGTGAVDNPNKIVAEYLGEAMVERRSTFTVDVTNPDIMRTSDSSYRVLSNRVITE